MGRRSFRESKQFTKRLDELGGWQNDDLDMVMCAALVAMTMYPEKQAIVNEAALIRVVETNALRLIPALEIFFYVVDTNTVEGLDIIEYPTANEI